ncbi:MAG: electron transport complex subunit RsxC [Pseudomonadota bacterium]|nr:electron transport complex subunit RsxC [Pseudomonadota bacterium]
MTANKRLTSVIAVSEQGLVIDTIKQPSRAKTIARLEPPKRLTYPLIDRRFGALTPKVKPGQCVRKGELLAIHDFQQGLNVHCALPGRVLGVERHVSLSHLSSASPCLVIDVEASQETHSEQHLSNTALSMPALHEPDWPMIIQRVAETGIVGLGGAGFPTAQKMPHELQYVVINAAECEPFITADERLIIEQAQQIAQGIELIETAAKPERIIVAIEEDKTEAIACLQKALPKQVEFQLLASKYPTGSERQLVRALLGNVPDLNAPLKEFGIWVVNIATLFAIKRAVLDGEVLTQRVVTVAGAAIAEPRNYWLPIGMPVNELAQQLGLDKKSGADDTLEWIHGGPMMGVDLQRQNIPVEKVTNALLLDPETNKKRQAKARPCIRCGKCEEACPEFLLPQQLLKASEHDAQEVLESLKLEQCLECGACDFVCPSDIPLAQHFAEAKVKLRTTRQTQSQAQAAKLRYERRAQRLLQREEQREALKLERAKARKARVQSAKPQAKVGTEAVKLADQKIVKSSPEQERFETTDSKQLKTELAKAQSIYQQAEKALAQAKKQNMPKLEQLEAHVAQLKARVEAAQQAYDQQLSGGSS